MTAPAWILLSALASSGALAQELAGESPRTTALELKLGGYFPLIDRAPGLTGKPYEETFGTRSMLLFEVEGDRQLWQKVGSAAIGISAGYAEKYARARVAGTGVSASESTALKVLPLKLLGVYRFDWAALRHGVPVVPYLKGGLAVTPFWALKGSAVETVGGTSASGAQWGYAGVLGLSVLLDFFEPRLARDMDSTSGVNHSYFFAEYVAEEVNDFGRGGPGALDLSSRRWMFGLMLEY